MTLRKMTRERTDPNPRAPRLLSHPLVHGPTQLLSVHALMFTSLLRDPLEKIKKLKELLDAGALTQKEFDEKKAELMARVH